MLYISLLLWSDYINNAGKASVQHNEIIFLISVDSYGNSLANNLLHHQWPQITAVFKNLSRSWKLRRLITWTERDRKMCQKLLWLKLLTLSCSHLFSPLPDSESRCAALGVQWVNKRPCCKGNGGAAQHQRLWKAGWEVGRWLCVPPELWRTARAACTVLCMSCGLCCSPSACCPCVWEAGSESGWFLLVGISWKEMSAVPKICP